MKLADMTAMTGTVSGEDDVVLVAALDGFRSFTEAGFVEGGDGLPYRIEANDGKWEVGVGYIYEDAGTWYLSRYAETYISFTIGSTCKVYLTLPSFAHVVSAPGSTKIAPTVGNGGVAGGNGAISGSGGVALCDSASAGVDAIAVGRYAQATANGGVALGKNAKALECSVVSRQASASANRSCSLDWVGEGAGMLAAKDQADRQFIPPNVKCNATLEVLFNASNSGQTDRFAAKAYLMLQRTAVNATLTIVGTPVINVIVPDNAGTATVSFAITGTGATSSLSIKPSSTTMNFTATVHAAVTQMS